MHYVDRFSDDVTVHFHLNKHERKLDVLTAIDAIDYVYGFTNRADALRIMRTTMFDEDRGDRPDIQVRYLILHCTQL